MVTKHGKNHFSCPHFIPMLARPGHDLLVRKQYALRLYRDHPPHSPLPLSSRRRGLVRFVTCQAVRRGLHGIDVACSCVSCYG